MSEPLLIGLNGKARAGKDTVANFIEDYGKEAGFTVAREAFARRLKESAAHALGVFENEIEFCDKLKGEYERGHVEVRIATKDGGPNTVVARVTGREFLQLYGTEAHRDVFGNNFWVDAVLPLGEWDGRGLEPAWWAHFSDDTGVVANICVITDVRFDNEAERIKELGGQVWEIVRDGSGAGGHASEQYLSGGLVDLVIDNNGTYDTLKGSTYYVLEDMVVTA